jgi:hypothetical protein
MSNYQLFKDSAPRSYLDVLPLKAILVRHNMKQNNFGTCSAWGARGSLLVKALGYKSEGRGFENRLGELLNLPNPSGCTRPWVYSASNRNEYRKHEKKNVSGE